MRETVVHVMGSLHFSLVPPIGWRELAIEPEHRDRQIEESLRGLSQIVPNWSDAYAMVRRGMVNSYANAWASGIRYAITSVPDDSQPMQIMASYMIAVLPAASPDDAEVFSAIVSSVEQEREMLTDGESLDVSRVKLPPLGDVIQADDIRYASTGTHALPGKRNAMIAGRRLFIPAYGKVFVATGSTPQIEISEVLFELFSRITQTLRIWTEDMDANGTKETPDEQL